MRDNDLEFSIVSGSDEEMLFGCIESLKKTLRGSSYSWSITVTCNATVGGLSNRLRSRYPGIIVLENDASKAIAASHNRVLRISRARYVWLLDSDILILPDAVRLVTEFLDLAENARVGVAGPQLLKADGTLQLSSYPFPSMQRVIMTELGLSSSYGDAVTFDHDRPGRGPGGNVMTPAIEVDTLAAGCIAVRTSGFRQVGQMVETALPGSELPEWHRRFHEQGWKVVYCPDASVIHYGSKAIRDHSRSFYADHLKGALYFFKTGRSPATYGLFCATLLGMFGMRAAFSWAMRDRSALHVARHSAAIAWKGLSGS